MPDTLIYLNVKNVLIVSYDGDTGHLLLGVHHVATSNVATKKQPTFLMFHSSLCSHITLRVFYVCERQNEQKCYVIFEHAHAACKIFIFYFNKYAFDKESFVKKYQKND